MRLVSFSVKNYRSIIEAYKLSLGNYTVLVGPNNEGKSNIVKSLVLSLSFLTRKRQDRRSYRAQYRYRRSEFRYDYDWQRDFPISLQKRSSRGRSLFTLEFELSKDELEIFYKNVGVKLKTNLKLKLGFGAEGYTFEVLINGRVKKTLTKKRDEICSFIRDRATTQYISALRPSDMALDLIHQLISKELFSLERDPQYRDLVKKLQDFQQPTLNEIAKKLKNTVSDFVPAVKDVKITNELSRAMRSNFKIFVDDGAETELSSKGDGIVSLTTMSLMKHISQERLGEESLILAIEEPESHLHPDAIHGLRKVLKDISKDQQVIITTHSPLLVEREQINQNILVRSGRASRARKIGDVRDALGIKMADNLIGAYVVLLVEGEEDRDILNVWLRHLSATLRSALSKRLLVIDDLGGASNLHYKTTFYKNNVYNIHAFLDNDSDGRKAVQDALDRNIIDNSDYNLTVCGNMKNSELEDLLVLDHYEQAVLENFGVRLTIPKFKKLKRKWSERVQRLFTLSGKTWNKSIKMRVKRHVIDSCVKKGISSLNEHKKGPIEALITSLEAKLLSKNI